ncbi:MAG: hypothetical protein PHG66_00810 [Candidatus Colwellbacteria bacterium]|nr:hypothetical protein [Candidatus Colwellbacteria bacterium]
MPLCIMAYDIQSDKILIENKCVVCGKKCSFNYKTLDYGVRCRIHKLEEMVNISSPEYCEKRFVKTIDNLKGKVVGKYTGDGNPVECVCEKGHVCHPRPTHIKQGRGMCFACSGKDSKTAENNFYKNIILLGGKVLGEYTGNDKPVECLCSNGHICNPRPGSIQQGQGMCIICSGLDSKTAENNFYKNIILLGGKVLGEYNGNDKPVECLCSNGHICNPRPGSIQQGKGMCIICSGLDPKTAEYNFYKNVTLLGGKVIGKYVNSTTQVECICCNNHQCYSNPSSLQQGKGMCIICAKQDPKTAEDNFHKYVSTLDGKVIGKYVNSYTQVECICSNGHTCNPYPCNISKGLNICKICAGQDLQTSTDKFIKNIHKLGGKVIGTYINNRMRVECICIANHKCWPIPSSIQQGQGMCPKCAKTSFSKISFEFLDGICLSQKISLQTAKSEEGEFKIPDTKYKVDGYHKETNTVYEFHGCYWHGCPMCFDPEKMNDISNKTFGKLHDKTLHREELIRSKGYNLVVMWECDWKEKLVI